MDAVKHMMRVHDLDVILREANDRRAWGRLGFGIGAVEGLEQERDRLLASIDPRWTLLYDRAHRRYGRGLTPVRERVCMGCFVRLPASATPAAGGAMLHLCESCGRLLYWG